MKNPGDKNDRGAFVDAGGLDVDIRLALDRFPLEVAFQSSAPVTGVFGPSGSGKTSLLESVAGLRDGTRGHIRCGATTWLDTDQSRSLDPALRGVGYVPQDGLLFPHRSVRGNLEAGRRRALLTGDEYARMIDRVSALLELDGLLERSIATLSGGERQRVALARAICSGPALLFLDEPFAALDLPLRRRLLPFLLRVQREFDIPMFLVSHDPTEVQALCDDLIVLDRGHILARGTPRDVLTDPEVFPLTERAGFENILPARVTKDRGSSSVLELGETPTGVPLITPRSRRNAGESLWVAIASNDIMVALEPVQGISARNVLHATVVEIHAMGGLRLISTELHPDIPRVSVEVTEMTTTDLHLAPGSSVYLLIKAFSCRLYDSVPLS